MSKPSEAQLQRALEIVHEHMGWNGPRSLVDHIAQALADERDRTLGEAIAAADDVSHLTTQPGNSFDEGYSQGRYEAAQRIRALAADGLEEARKRDDT